ncbi:MAG TPA: radical SAM protein [Terriglobales bacterium]|jgi:DNA repair photolyase|nr:radical SAM protein [Terriglobales bacterium]
MPHPAVQLFPLPDSGAPALAGIARLAAMGESISEGYEVEYFTLPVKSLLNRCTSARMPFTWTINPYRGCEFACKYCYARYTHEFMEMRDGVDFERKIYIKQQAAWLLRQDLKKVKRGEEIAIGTATDPYQPAERRHGITRAILEELALHAGLEIGIVTKSNLVLRDAALLRRIADRNQLYVNVTVTTLDARLARILEPRAPRPGLRLDAVRKLNDAGVSAGVICAPVVPGITDDPKSLDALVRATKEAGGRYIFANPLFLKPCSASIFLPFLEKEFPHLVESYRKRYASRAFLPASYRKRISSLMGALRRKHGFQSREESMCASYPPSEEAQQLALFR